MPRKVLAGEPRLTLSEGAGRGPCGAGNRAAELSDMRRLPHGAAGDSFAGSCCTEAPSLKTPLQDLLDCRKSLAFGLECRDRGACGDSDCGDANVARRAGMTCSSFPW
eukprot:scaffold1883_cov261-Pinguiococcus_pyrenoidosus.AAC.34